MRNRKEIIISLLHKLETETLINIWNEYCQEYNMDDYIYNNDEYTLQDMFCGSQNPVDEALRAAFYGDYRYGDEYVIFNAYGNLKSFDKYDAEENIYFEDLAEYIMNNDCQKLQDECLEDIEANFIEFFNDKFEDTSIDEDYDLSYWNLLTEDWDDICNEIIEELNNEENEN